MMKKTSDMIRKTTATRTAEEIIMMMMMMMIQTERATLRTAVRLNDLVQSKKREWSLELRHAIPLLLKRWYFSMIENFKIV